MARASRAFLHMIFRDGFFHCDPHPGNLIVEPCGRIAIVDFGRRLGLREHFDFMTRQGYVRVHTIPDGEQIASVGKDGHLGTQIGDVVDDVRRQDHDDIVADRCEQV